MSADLPAAIEEFRRNTGAAVLETAISWVLLTEDRAYKVKKAVDLPFIDYSTSARRCHWCHEELRLNRRFAPDLYLGVQQFGLTADSTTECAVVMRRFDEGLRLDHECHRNGLTTAQVSELARVVIDMHDAADAAAADTSFGTADEVLRVVLESLSELAPGLPQESDRLARFDDWLRAEHHSHTATFARRKAEGRIREGHGDLHLANLVLLDGHIVPFDCIEFSAELRWIDIASELAFTYVDLLDHQRGDLAGWLLNEWLSDSGDYQAMATFRFYAVYRALVRAKVAARSDDLAKTLGYLDLVDSIVTGRSPRLLITHGLSGSGKTVASGALVLADGGATTVRLRSDIERRRLGHGYSAAESEATYRILAQRAADLLDLGWSVIVDAAFLSRARRDEFRAVARTADVTFGIINCDAPLETLRQRIATRTDDASEATSAVLDWQVTSQDPLTADEVVDIRLG